MLQNVYSYCISVLTVYCLKCPLHLNSIGLASCSGKAVNKEIGPRSPCESHRALCVRRAVPCEYIVGVSHMSALWIRILHVMLGALCTVEHFPLIAVSTRSPLMWWYSGAPDESFFKNLPKMA